MDSKKMKNAVDAAKAEVTKVADQLAESAGPVLDSSGEVLLAAEKQARSAVRKATHTVKKAAKDVSRQAASAAAEVYVEFGSKQYACADLVERCRADYRETHKGAIRSCRIYVKPEDGMAYYVINSKAEGRIIL